MADELVKTEPLHPLALIQQAIAKGVDADYMGKLVALKDAIDRREAEKDFWQAMRDAQAEMPAILKDKANPFLKTKYGTYESLNKTIRPIYTKHGFSMTFTEIVGAREGFVRLVCDVGHEAGHVRRYEGDYPLDGIGAGGNKSGMNAIQAVGSTRSYAKRYLAKDIWNLAETDEDNDGQNNVQLVSETQAHDLGLLVEEAYPTEQKLERFKAWLLQTSGVDSVDKLPMDHYQRILQAVKGVLEKQKGGKP